MKYFARTLRNIRVIFPNSQKIPFVLRKYSKDDKHNSSIWRENMRGYFPLDIICFRNLLLVNSSHFETDNVRGQIPKHISRQTEAIVE